MRNFGGGKCFCNDIQRQVPRRLHDAVERFTLAPSWTGIQLADCVKRTKLVGDEVPNAGLAVAEVMDSTQGVIDHRQKINLQIQFLLVD